MKPRVTDFFARIYGLSSAPGTGRIAGSTASQGGYTTPAPSQISRTELFISLCLLAGLIGIAGPARGFQQRGSNFGLEGKITGQSPGKLTVSSQDNMIFHVTYNEQTKISHKNGSAGSAADLIVGTEVRVDGSLTAQGILEARSIHVE